jgi:hypothetical protein
MVQHKNKKLRRGICGR